MFSSVQSLGHSQKKNKKRNQYRVFFVSVSQPLSPQAEVFN